MVSLCDTWLGHGFFSRAAHPASMCHGGLAACSGFPNPSQVDLNSRVSPSPLSQAPTVGNSLTTGTESQAAFSAERFHPKPGSIQPQGQDGCHSCDLGLRCHAAAFHLLSQGTVLSVCQCCAASVSCILKASALPLASRPQEAGKSALARGSQLRLLIVPTPEVSCPVLVSTKGGILLPPGAEKKPSAFHLLTARCTQVEEWGLSLHERLSLPKGQALLPPAPRSTGTSQGLTGPFWHIDSTHSSCRKLVPPAAPSCSTVQSPAQGRAT